MSSDLVFTGSESPADIARVAISKFSSKSIPHTTIFYDNSIPKMKYEFQGATVEYSCIYRLDLMLEEFYPEAERIFDEMAKLGLFPSSYREILVRLIAFSGMTTMLTRLVSLQAQIFGENYAETRVTARSMFLQSIIAAYAKPQNKAQLTKTTSQTVKRWIDEVVANSMKKKREFLVGFMNRQPLLRIQGVGRPLGSTKPPEQKAREADRFRKDIKEAIQSLITVPGKAPKKTDVAKKLRIGGHNPKSGNYTYLHAFRSKLTRLGVDYDEVLTEMGLNK